MLHRLHMHTKTLLQFGSIWHWHALAACTHSHLILSPDRVAFVAVCSSWTGNWKLYEHPAGCTGLHWTDICHGKVCSNMLKPFCPYVIAFHNLSLAGNADALFALSLFLQCCRECRLGELGIRATVPSCSNWKRVSFDMQSCVWESWFGNLCWSTSFIIDMLHSSLTDQQIV